MEKVLKTGSNTALLIHVEEWPERYVFTSAETSTVALGATNEAVVLPRNVWETKKRKTGVTQLISKWGPKITLVTINQSVAKPF